MEPAQNLNPKSGQSLSQNQKPPESIPATQSGTSGSSLQNSAASVASPTPARGISAAPTSNPKPSASPAPTPVSAPPPQQRPVQPPVSPPQNSPAQKPVFPIAPPAPQAVPVTAPVQQPSGPLAQQLKPKVEADPEGLVYRTMPKSSAPFASAKPLIRETPPMPPPDSSLPGTPNFGSSGSGRRPSRADLVIRIALIVLATGFVIFAGIFAYRHFIAKPKTDLVSNQTQTNNASDNSSGQSQQTQPQSQIPGNWLQKFFGSSICSNQDVCGDNADPDHDGLTNLEEYKTGTDPNNPDSDGDGIADGDEVHVFNLDPNNPKTAGIPAYTDWGDLKHKWNSHTHQYFTDTELVQIAANIKQYGLHSPTTKTLTPDIITFYTNYSTGQNQNTTQDQSGALDRDTQRSYTIKQIAYGLLAYYQANQTYPDTTDFSEMVSIIKPLLAGKAVNAIDPTNVAPYVYTYQPINGATDFQIGYFSETAHQQIILHAADAQADLVKDQADQNDTKRINDLEQITSALNLYSTDNANPNNPEQRVYPPQATWKQALATKYMAIIPVDPKTNQDYVYMVSADNASFSLTAVLEDPPTGKKNYVCTQDGCDYQ